MNEFEWFFEQIRKNDLSKLQLLEIKRGERIVLMIYTKKKEIING